MANIEDTSKNSQSGEIRVCEFDLYTLKDLERLETVRYCICDAIETMWWSDILQSYLRQLDKAIDELSALKREAQR